MAETIPLVVIGVVRSPITELSAMPTEGVRGQISILPEFWPALDEIESNSHLIILGWFHAADRSKLQASGRSRKQKRGVFGLRSSSRPNPIGMDVVGLLAVDHERGLLDVDRLDFVDGTQVVDIKRYSAPWDSVFAARSSRDWELGERSPDELRDELTRAAVNFHGEWCRGAAVGVRLLADALGTWQVSPRNPDLRFSAGTDGCMLDALQGMTGATVGNGRLKIGASQQVQLQLNDKERWLFDPATDLRDPPDELVRRRLAELGKLQVLPAPPSVDGPRVPM